MKSTFAKAVLAAAALSISACATTSMVQVWRDPSYVAAPVHRILVVSVIPNDAYRAAFDNATAQALASKGFSAVGASSLFPPGQLDKDVVVSYVKQQDIDLVVVQRITKQTEVQYNPPAVMYAPPPAYGGWYGYYGYGYGTVYAPGYYSDSTTVAAEVNVYAAKANPERLVWSGTSRTFNFQGAVEAAQSVAYTLLDDLIRAGILVR